MITKYDVLRKPLFTEKAMLLQELGQKNFRLEKNPSYNKEDKSSKKFSRVERPYNVVVLQVHPEATKTQIKEAVEEFFKVKVEHVRTMNMKGTEKRFGRNVGRTKDWKKAIVTLKEGEKLEFV